MFAKGYGFHQRPHKMNRGGSFDTGDEEPGGFGRGLEKIGRRGSRNCRISMPEADLPRLRHGASGGGRKDAGQLSLFPSLLCRADAEAAAPRCPPGLHARPLDQPEQPCSRRGPGQFLHGKGGGGRNREAVRLGDLPGPSHERGNDGQPGGALGRRAAEARPENSGLRPGPLYPPADFRCPGAPLRERSLRCERTNGYRCLFKF